MRSIFNEKRVKEYYDKIFRFKCNDCLNYFFDRIEMFEDFDYTPTFEDTQRMHAPFQGVLTYDVNLYGAEMQITAIQTEGEIRKFTSFFEDLRTIVYVVDLSLFDDESLYLYAAIDEFEQIGLRCKVPIFLIFSKIDLFKHKIAIHSVSNYFPEYQGDNSFLR